jgi:hypothetical protein
VRQAVKLGAGRLRGRHGITGGSNGAGAGAAGGGGLASVSAPVLGLAEQSPRRASTGGLTAGSTSSSTITSLTTGSTSTITTNHRQQSSRRRRRRMSVRKESSSSSSVPGAARHDGSTVFSNEPFINRLAGPNASTRMIANGQIHRGVQQVQQQQPRQRPASASASGRRGARRSQGHTGAHSSRLRRTGTGAGNAKPRRQEQQQHEEEEVKRRSSAAASARPKSAPLVHAGPSLADAEADGAGSVEVDGEQMVMVSMSQFTALEERCRMLEQSLRHEIPFE